MTEHPIDRFMRAIRPLLIGLLFLALPVMLLSYGWMLKQLLYAAPFWVSAAVVLAHMVTWLGIASLFDKQQERRQSSERGQSAPLPPMKRAGLR